MLDIGVHDKIAAEREAALGSIAIEIIVEYGHKTWI